MTQQLINVAQAVTTMLLVKVQGLDTLTTVIAIVGGLLVIFVADIGYGLHRIAKALEKKL